jgi:hypothetical protein
MKEISCDQCEKTKICNMDQAIPEQWILLNPSKLYVGLSKSPVQGHPALNVITKHYNSELVFCCSNCLTQFFTECYKTLLKQVHDSKVETIDSKRTGLFYSM